MALQIDFSGKTALVMGLRNKWSIAWYMTLFLLQAGAQVLLSYHRDKSKEKIENELMPTLPVEWQKKICLIGKCDVGSEEDVINLFLAVKDKVGKLDFLVHCVASAANVDMVTKKKFLDITREEMLKTIEISATSLISIVREFVKLANPRASIVSISYYGSRHVVPEYASLAPSKVILEEIIKLLGRQFAYDLGRRKIRANVVVAPAVLTTAARPFRNIEKIINYQEKKSPLRVRVTQKMIAKAAFICLTDFAEAITGQPIYADAGFSILAPHF